MHLTPKEIDRLLLFLAAELARRRRGPRLRLNYPEARALIADEICEGARDGALRRRADGARRRHADDGRRAPRRRELSATLQVEGFFDDGQKLVTVHEPIGPGSEPAEGPSPGEVVARRRRDRAQRRARDGALRSRTRRPAGAGRLALPLLRGQPRARFDRAQAFGMRLDIPAGTAVRFEPGRRARGRPRRVRRHARGARTNGLTEGRRASATPRAARSSGRATAASWGPSA